MEHQLDVQSFDVALGNHRLPEQLPCVTPDSRKRKRARERDWKEVETSASLKCVNLPQFRHQKRNQYYMKWDAIAEEIQRRLERSDSAITGKRCKERMKTLRGYYQQVRTKTKKAGVSGEEWRKSNGVAVDWWYNAIGEFRGPREGKSRSTRNEGKSAKNRIATRFNSLDDSQRSTLLDLTFSADYFEEIRVIALERVGLVRKEQVDDEEGEESDDDGQVTSESCLHVPSLRVYEKFYKKATIKNPAYDTRRRIQDDAMVTFDASHAPWGVIVLNQQGCEQLEVVDLSGIQKLRFLSIWRCPKLREMIGCECVEELGWLEIYDCPSYHGYPPLQKFPSLQEFYFFPHIPFLSYSRRVRSGGELDVSGCVRLRVLAIVNDDVLSSIHGLEGLRSLTILELWNCNALRKLPDIGHMKDLTRLSIACTAVEEIEGVEELSSLKSLK